jgi:predicted nucleic acid-binding protein
MTFLLDTDIVSAFNKRTFPPKLKDWLRVNAGACFLSVVTIAEMRYGLPGVASADHAVMAERVAQTELRFLHALEPLDVNVLTRWKHLLAFLKSKNRTIANEDSLIAATALANGHALVTANVKHFLPAADFGLEIINPLAV